MSNEVKGLLVVIAIVALVGNMLTVVLFIKKSKWLKKAHGCLIFALSIQDILTAICLLSLPSFVLDHDAYPLPSSPIARDIFCSLVWSQYFPFALGVTSVYTCLVLTIERWFAVVKPLYYRRYERSTALVAALVLIPWVAGFFFEISTPLNAKPIEQNGTFICGWEKVESSATERIPIAVFSFLGLIFIPAMTMVVAYFQIILHVKRSRIRVSVSVDDSPNMTSTGKFNALKRVTLTAFFASTIVVVCWLPDQLYYALSLVELTQLGTPAHSALKLLAFANSCVNPFIYSFSNREYRNGLKEIFLFAANRERDVVGLTTEGQSSQRTVMSARGG